MRDTPSVPRQRGNMSIAAHDSAAARCGTGTHRPSQADAVGAACTTRPSVVALAGVSRGCFFRCVRMPCSFDGGGFRVGRGSNERRDGANKCVASLVPGWGLGAGGHATRHPGSPFAGKHRHPRLVRGRASTPHKPECRKTSMTWAHSPDCSGFGSRDAARRSPFRAVETASKRRTGLLFNGRPTRQEDITAQWGRLTRSSTISSAVPRQTAIGLCSSDRRRLRRLSETAPPRTDPAETGAVRISLHTPRTKHCKGRCLRRRVVREHTGGADTAFGILLGEPPTNCTDTRSGVRTQAACPFHARCVRQFHEQANTAQHPACLLRQAGIGHPGG